MKNDIRYLKQKDIDREKWDKCVSNAENGLIYGMSWYLDAVCDHWDGLVLNDYQAVMPLPWKRKYGLKYVMQPNYCKVLGIFGDNADHKLVKGFVNSIPKRFIYTKLMINEAVTAKPVGLIQRIDLTKTIAFSKSTKKNINKAYKNGLSARMSRLESFLTLFHSVSAVYRTDKMRQNILNMLDDKNILDNSLFVEVLYNGIHSISVVWLIRYNGTIYSMLTASTDNARQLNAKYLERDFIVKHVCKNLRFFDFTGSTLTGVYNFNKGFANSSYSYYELKKWVFMKS